MLTLSHQFDWRLVVCTDCLACVCVCVCVCVASSLENCPSRNTAKIVIKKKL